MSLVTHKYTPAEMSEQELEATFAAREHTVDYLLKSLRDQIHSGTLSSHIITGPRGAGKSTVIQMVALRIKQDPQLSAAWLPIIFPEEQFNLISLRDLLEAILAALGKQQIPGTQEWLAKVKNEMDEEQSQQLGITGIREIVKQTEKRLILFIENLDQFLGHHLDYQMKGTLRRLLMSEPSMMIIGSTVHLFDSLKKYDEAFFNYFGQVPLDRLSSEQVSELLRKRAEFDHNENFLRELPQQQAKIRTLVHLTGGNPRFVLMLYELLSLQKVTTIVQYLRRLVDELTPLLKDEMERLPGQQQKIIHALMEKGGTAQPADLVGPTRLSLNVITMQLKRLKDAQIVEVLGGGKGRAANYTFPDKLFSIWYQMRYLSQNRRRIELFVEVLRVWFDEEKRIQTLQNFAKDTQNDVSNALRECATTAEYFAASLKGTKHELLANDLCISSWLKTDLQEAMLAYTDLCLNKPTVQNSGVSDRIELSKWCIQHGNLKQAIEILNQTAATLESHQPDMYACVLLIRSAVKAFLGENEEAIKDITTLLANDNIPEELKFLAHEMRGHAKSKLKDLQGAISDLQKSQSKKADRTAIAYKLLALGTLKLRSGDFHGALRELSSIEMKDLSKAGIHEFFTRSAGGLGKALFDLAGFAKAADFSSDYWSRAMISRGYARQQLGDSKGAIADFTAAIENKDASSWGVATALACRGTLSLSVGDFDNAIDDLDRAIESSDNPEDQFGSAFLSRGICFAMKGNYEKATSDFSVVMERPANALDDIFEIYQVILRISAKSADKKFIADILDRLPASLNAVSVEIARETALRILNCLAEPEGNELWTHTWRILAKGLKPETSEAIKFLEPVCHVLEGKDRALLNALPPEQREFALEVLEKFSPLTTREPSANYSKTKKKKTT